LKMKMTYMGQAVQSCWMLLKLFSHDWMLLTLLGFFSSMSFFLVNVLNVVLFWRFASIFFQRCGSCLLSLCYLFPPPPFLMWCGTSILYEDFPFDNCWEGRGKRRMVYKMIV
jgi:hypothetical protein